MHLKTLYTYAQTSLSPALCFVPLTAYAASHWVVNSEYVRNRKQPPKMKPIDQALQRDDDAIQSAFQPIPLPGYWLVGTENSIWVALCKCKACHGNAASILQ